MVLAFVIGFSQSAHAAISSSLRVGSRGAQVTELQQTLTNLGFYSGPITGRFGGLTRAAVIRFQKANNIRPAIGFFGSLSRAKLNQLVTPTPLGTPVPMPSSTPTPVSVPHIKSLQPSSGLVGISVTISGSGFRPTGNKIKFGDQGSENNPTYSLNSTDGTTIIFTVPSGNYMSCWNSTPACYTPVLMTQPGIYQVSVINVNGTSNELPFTVTAQLLSS